MTRPVKTVAERYSLIDVRIVLFADENHRSRIRILRFFSFLKFNEFYEFFSG